MEGLRILPRVKELLSGRSWIWTQVCLVPKIHSASYLPKCQRSGEGWSVDSKTPPPTAHRVSRPFPVQTVSWIPEVEQAQEGRTV